MEVGVVWVVGGAGGPVDPRPRSAPVRTWVSVCSAPGGPWRPRRTPLGANAEHRAQSLRVPGPVPGGRRGSPVPGAPGRALGGALGPRLGPPPAPPRSPAAARAPAAHPPLLRGARPRPPPPSLRHKVYLQQKGSVEGRAAEGGGSGSRARSRGRPGPVTERTRSGGTERRDPAKAPSRCPGPLRPGRGPGPRGGPETGGATRDGVRAACGRTNLSCDRLPLGSGLRAPAPGARARTRPSDCAGRCVP